jgi:probable phosphoglycerate mutase
VSEGARLILLRHGETTHNAAGIYQGQLDTDLSARGVAQAACAASGLALLSPTRIVSSDLRRAAHTAAVLGDRTALTVQHDPRLREIDVGVWSGRSHSDVVKDYPDETRAIGQGVDVRRGGHGESVHDVSLRTREVAIEVAESMSPGEVVVLVTHGVAARALLSALLGWSYEQAWLGVAGLRNCHWAELAHHRTGWRLVSWNASASVDDRFETVPDGAPRS